MVPAACAGLVTVHSVLVGQFTPLAFVRPNLNVVAVVPVRNPAPVTVTCVPPVVEPVLGARPLTTGVYLKWSWLDAVLVPPGVETVMSTVPASPGGANATRPFASFLKLVAGAEPNFTAVTLTTCSPLMVTFVPPVAGPVAGETFRTTGGLRAENEPNEATVPAAFVTLIGPEASAGSIAVIDVGELTVNEVAGFVPNMTAVTPANSVPASATEVPPAQAPSSGEKPVTVGHTPSGGIPQAYSALSPDSIPRASCTPHTVTGTLLWPPVWPMPSSPTSSAPQASTVPLRSNASP